MVDPYEATGAFERVAGPEQALGGLTVTMYRNRSTGEYFLNASGDNRADGTSHYGEADLEALGYPEGVSRGVQIIMGLAVESDFQQHNVGADRIGQGAIEAALAQRPAG